MTDTEVHITYLQEALREANKCTPVMTAFCVGCLIVTHWPDLQSPGIVLATGYSRELPGNTHAEANALAKVKTLTDHELAMRFRGLSPSREELLKNADVYTTMEPCSVRTSGLAPCADALIAAHIRRCVIGVAEPNDFVTCEGTRKLREAGIDVVYVRDMEVDCLAAARRGHASVTV